MEIVNGSMVVEADGVRHIVAEFSFDGLKPSLEAMAFCVQFLDLSLRKLVNHRVPVHCEYEPMVEFDEYDATIVVVFPDSDWVARLWPVMVFLSKTMSNVVESETDALIVWATYEEMGVQA